MKIDIKKYKQFKEESGLGFGQYCVFLIVLEQDKNGLKLLWKEESSLLHNLILEGLVQHHQDVIDGNPQDRIKLTEDGYELAKRIRTEADNARDVLDILDHFNQTKIEHGVSGKVSPTKNNIKLVEKWLKEFSEAQIIQVIEYFVPAWKDAKYPDGTSLAKYLKPATIFNNKFPERVDEAEQSKPVFQAKNQFKPL